MDKMKKQAFIIFLVTGTLLFINLVSATTITYSTPGSFPGAWTVPAGVTSVTAKVWGGGGGGGGGGVYGAGGGGGGAYDEVDFNVNPGNSWNVVVGYGGGWHYSNAGESGALSSFSYGASYATAGGGGGGGAGFMSCGGGGSYGIPSSNGGSGVLIGGGNGYACSSCRSGAGGDSGYGGGGGAYVNGYHNGNPGGFPAGGGSGGSCSDSYNYHGGTGANGQVTLTYTLDTNSPSISIIYPTATNYSTNVSALNYSVSDTSLQTCWYSTNGGATNVSVACGTNLTGLTSTEGSNTWLVGANDTFNNKNSTIVTFFKDTITPQINFTYPTSSSGNQAYKSIWANVSATDTNFRNVTINLYNSIGIYNSTSYKSGNFFVNFTNLPDGTYYFNATDYDTSGNTNSTVTRTITIDTKSPSISIIYPTATNYSTNVSALNYSVSDTSLQTCWYSTNGGATNVSVACGTNLTGLTSTEGSNTWLVGANDTFNNKNSTIVTFIKDTLPPIINFTFPTETSGSILAKRDILVNVTATDSYIGLKNITIYLYNSSNSMLVIATSYSSPNYNKFTGLSNGLYYFNATACDLFSHCNSTETRSVTISTLDVNLISPLNNSVAGKTQEFTCNASGTNLRNITFYLWNSTDIANQTTFYVNGSYNISDINITFTYSDNFNWNCLAINNKSIMNWAATNNTLIVDVSNPIINMIAPLQYSYHPSGNTTFSCTPTGTSLDSLMLYGMFDGTYKLNQSIAAVSGTMHSFNIPTLPQGRYNWTCAVNKTTGDFTWGQQGNYTFWVDTTPPSISLSEPLGTYNSIPIPFIFSASDNFMIDTCYYNVTSGGTTIIANTQIPCYSPVSTTFTVSSGNYLMTILALDMAGNRYSTSSVFSYSISHREGGGGGGETIITHNVSLVGICGTGICDGNKTFLTCPQDCPGNLAPITDCFDYIFLPKNTTIQSNNQCILKKSTTLLWIFLMILAIFIFSLFYNKKASSSKKVTFIPEFGSNKRRR
jgi:hypothetical protein